MKLLTATLLVGILSFVSTGIANESNSLFERIRKQYQKWTPYMTGVANNTPLHSLENKNKLALGKKTKQKIKINN